MNLIISKENAMKFWKTIGLIFCFVGLFAASVVAQKNVERTLDDIKKGNYGTPEQRAADLDKAMQQGLLLTKEQAPKVSEINVRYARRNETEVVQQQMSDWSKYRKISALQGEKDVELKKILTTEQFKKYQKKRDEAIWQAVKSWFW